MGDLEVQRMETLRLLASWSTEVHMRARETTGKKNGNMPRHSRHPLLVSGMRRGVEDGNTDVLCSGFSTPRTCCSLGVLSALTLLMPSFPPPSHSCSASGHVRYMTTSDERRIPRPMLRAPRLVFVEVGRQRKSGCICATSCPRWDNPALPAYTRCLAEQRKGASVSSWRMTHASPPRSRCASFPTRGPQVGDMTGNGRERILS
jgi:hypothetical protein